MIATAMRCRRSYRCGRSCRSRWRRRRRGRSEASVAFELCGFGAGLGSEEFIEREAGAAFGAAGFAQSREVVSAGGADDRAFAGGADSVGALGGGFTPEKCGSHEPQQRRAGGADEAAEIVI